MSFISTDPVSDATIIDVLRRRVANEPDKTAFVHLKSDSERESLTYGELDRRAGGTSSLRSSAVFMPARSRCPSQCLSSHATARGLQQWRGIAEQTWR